jgi:hypothetical protein
LAAAISLTQYVWKTQLADKVSPEAVLLSLFFFLAGMLLGHLLRLWSWRRRKEFTKFSVVAILSLPSFSYILDGTYLHQTYFSLSLRQCCLS